jgi:uncharacterized protein (DUF2147 family)
MKRLLPYATALLAVSAGCASAAEPIGEWLVDGGYAQVRIDNCEDRLWGIVAWEKIPGGVDRNNPDPTKRSRPVLGLPILLGMTPAQGRRDAYTRYDGEIYNTEDGRTYTAHIQLQSDDVLRVEGCVLGFLCGGQNWTRVKPPAKTTGQSAPPRASATAPAPPRAGTPSSSAAAPPPRAGTPPPGAAAPPPASEVCIAVAAMNGPPPDPRAAQSGRNPR